MRRTRERGFELGEWILSYTMGVEVLLAGIVLSLSSGSQAQIDRAALSGTITDPSRPKHDDACPPRGLWNSARNSVCAEGTLLNS
jgi:hypothetical protein